MPKINPLCVVFLLTLCMVNCTPYPIYISPEKGSSTGRTSIFTKSERVVKPKPIPLPNKTAHPVSTESIDTTRAYQIGVSSFYGKKFHGRKTANGETFNMYKLTAAHRVLPLGTYVRVTHLDNGRWVEVKVNDRGPFIEGRILDLSFAAALEIEMVNAGKARVMIEIMDVDN
ncbi:MAG: septal ring lytic transglycosylase RlpA family protein [Candidatus Latescibacterota bacterium]|nr:septal ring lytic transglycosylase RlpA family protein [Candidatus Latescibacterota bacterium]